MSPGGGKRMSEFVAAECAVRQLQARCVDAVWRRDTEAFADCFTEDAEWKIAGMRVRGRGEIAATFDALKATWERILMSFGAPILEVGAAMAFGRTPFAEMIKYSDHVIGTAGVYYEHFVDQGDRWRFQSRHCDFAYHGPPDFSAEFYDVVDYGPPPGMPGPANPTTMLRG